MKLLFIHSVLCVLLWHLELDINVLCFKLEAKIGANVDLLIECSFMVDAKEVDLSPLLAWYLFSDVPLILSTYEEEEWVNPF